MSKHRGNKEDDEIFIKILPGWNDVLESASKGEYKNQDDPEDGSLLTAVLELVCSEYGWSVQDFEDYQNSIRR